MGNQCCGFRGKEMFAGQNLASPTDTLTLEPTDGTGDGRGGNMSAAGEPYFQAAVAETKPATPKFQHLPSVATWLCAVPKSAPEKAVPEQGSKNIPAAASLFNEKPVGLFGDKPVSSTDGGSPRTSFSEQLADGSPSSGRSSENGNGIKLESDKDVSMGPTPTSAVKAETPAETFEAKAETPAFEAAQRMEAIGEQEEFLSTQAEDGSSTSGSSSENGHGKKLESDKVKAETPAETFEAPEKAEKKEPAKNNKKARARARAAMKKEPCEEARAEAEAKKAAEAQKKEEAEKEAAEARKKEEAEKEAAEAQKKEEAERKKEQEREKKKEADRARSAREKKAFMSHVLGEVAAQSRKLKADPKMEAQARVSARARDEARWKLLEEKTGEAVDLTLREADLPWPSGPEENPLRIDPEGHPEVVRSQIRAGLLRWHPDKFEQKFGRFLPKKEEERVSILARVKALAQQLTRQMARSV